MGTPGEAELATGTEHILLADDEVLIAQFAAEILAMAGYRVTTAANGLEALDLFRGDPAAFDLLLTDMTMPKMSGMELARQCLELRPELPIILCSGYNEEVSKESAFDSGLSAYLTKPIAGIQLCSIIRRVLDGEKLF